MARPVIYSGDIHSAILRGVDKVADAARLTLGPSGSEPGEGLDAARSLQLSDPIEKIGAQMLREVATRTARVIGDGTATATVLARAIYREGAKRVRAGADPLEVRRGIQMAVRAALAALDQIAQPVEDQDVARVATLLAGNDEQIGGLLVQALRGAGAEGSIVVEEAQGPESTVELVRRTSFDTTLLSPYFAADSGRETVFERPKVLLCDREIRTAQELLPVLKRAAREGRPLLIVSRDIQDDALFTLVANRLRGVLEVAAVMAPGAGSRRTAGLRDLAALTGAQLLTGRSGPARWRDLGEARRAVPTELYTTIFTDAGDGRHGEALTRRLRQIRGRLSRAGSSDKWALQQRLTQVEGTLVSLVEVGGPTAAARERKRARVETALEITRAAIRDGIVPGGGLALLRAIPALAELETAGGDVQAGVDVVRRAMQEPARRIAENAGRKGSDTVRRLLAAEDSVGYNAVTGRYEDLIAAGIVDPLKVTRTALLTAASIAAATLTTESMISERKVLAAAMDRGAAPVPVYSAPDGWSGYIPSTYHYSPPPPPAPPATPAASASKSAPQPLDIPEPPHKKINIWLGGTSGPIVPEKLYTLNLRVGERVPESLVQGSGTHIPLADIPPAGLPTTWEVLSDSVALMPTSGEVKVTSELVGTSVLWRATFSLLVPREGESDLVQLRIMAMRKERARLEVLVYARGEIYRQLEVALGLEDRPGDSATGVRNEMVYKLPGELGARPSHDWAEPPGRVGITVTPIGAHVQGRAPVRVGLWEANELVPWPPRAMVADAVKHVQEAAEAFRERWQDYLDDLPAEDFVQRLQAIGPSPGSLPHDWTELPDRADEDHRRAWSEKVTASPELFRLAFRGYALYQALFPRGSELRLQLDGLRPGVRLDLNWLDSIGESWISHVPWGLMYTEPPVEERPVDAMKFLGLRYRINYVPYQVKTPVGALGKPDAVYAAHCLYWGGDNPYGREARWQQERWGHLRNRVSIPDESGKGAKTRLRQLFASPEPRPMAILYFFCRSGQGSGSSASVLRFANSTQKDDNLAQDEMGLEALPDRPFVFANACSTAAPEDVYVANELERMFIKDRGCRAFLGTEAKVPVVLASRFAAAFFHFFYRQVDPATPVSAGEAVAQARLFLWTHYRNLGGLFYCLVNKYDLYMADEQEVLSLGA